MHQMLSSYPIHVDLHNPDSMAQALTQYAELIASGDAFRYTYCQYYFAFSQPYDWSQYPDQSIISSLLDNHMLLESAKQEFEEHFTSETCLFLAAIQHKELLPVLLNVAHAMRDRSRLVNNWYHLFISEDKFFGFDSLYILSYYYPEYGYLLTGFIPSNDQYSGVGQMNIVNAYVRRHGLCEHTIKAWCYCDHPMTRNAMLISDIFSDLAEVNTYEGESYAYESFESEEPISPLYDYFAHNQSAFEAFQTCLTQRFIEQPYLPFEEYLDPYDTWGQDIEPVKLATQPVDYFYASLLAHAINDYDGLTRAFTFPYLQASAQEVAREHTHIIEAKLGQPLSECIDPWATQRASIRYYSVNAARWAWDNLITEHITHGQAIWDYITQGGDDSILDNIPAINLHAVCKESHALCELKSASKVSEADFNAGIYDLVVDYVGDHLDCQPADQQPDNVLRFFDVVFRLRGGEPLNEQIKQLLTQTYPLIGADAFDARYRKQIASRKESELGGIVKLVSKLNLPNLERAYAIICRERDNAHTWYQDLDTLRRGGNSTKHAIAIMVVAKEGASPDSPDAFYHACRAYVDEAVVPAIIDTMKDKLATNHIQGESLTICEQRWQTLVDTLYGKTTLTVEEAESGMLLFYHPQASEECGWDRKLTYEGEFNGSHDSELLLAIWLLHDSELAIQPILSRILEAILFIEPLSIIEALYDFYLPASYKIAGDNGFDEDDENRRLTAETEAQLLAILTALSIPHTHYYAWLLNEAQFEDRWFDIVGLYGTNEHAELTQAIDAALLRTTQRQRVKFLAQVEDGSGKPRRIARKKLEEEALWAIENWLSRSLPQPEKRFYDALPAKQQLGYHHEGINLFGESNYMQVHALIDTLAESIPLAEAHNKVLVEQPVSRHECFMLQKDADNHYTAITKRWLIKAIDACHPHAFSTSHYPSIYVIDESVDAAHIAQLQQEVENGSFDKGVQQIMAYMRGEVSRDAIRPLTDGVEFKPLDYLPEGAESYSVEDLLEHLGVKCHNRLADILEPRKKGLLGRLLGR